jgi:PKD repeat protein
MVTATTTVIVDEGISGLIAINDSPTLLGEATNLTATVAAGSIVNYVWDFGDGTGSSGSQAAHVYPAAGVYTAVVAASNSINTVTATTQVLVVEAIAGLAVVSNSPVASGETMILTATVTAGSDVVYTWDFGDGNMGSGAVVNHVYVEAGGYRVVVTAMNAVSSMSVQTSVSVRASGYYIFMPVVVKGVVNSPQLPVLWKPLFDESS